MKFSPSESFHNEEENEDKLQQFESGVGKLMDKMETPMFRKADMLGDFGQLVEKLKDKLAGYDTILSDDTSGRLVSLVLRQVINEARRKEGADEGEVKTYFLAVGRHDRAEIFGKVRDFLVSKKDEIKKALMVTEHIATGDSIKKLIDIAEAAGIDFDLAALSVQTAPAGYNDKISKRLYYGSKFSMSGLAFYGNSKKAYSGIEKDTNSSNSPHPTKRSPSSPKDITAARRDAEKLAKALEVLL